MRKLFWIPALPFIVVGVPLYTIGAFAIACAYWVCSWAVKGWMHEWVFKDLFGLWAW